MRVLCNTLTLLKNLQEFLAMVLISDQSLYLSYVFTLSKVDTRNVAKVNMKWSSHMVVLIMKKKNDREYAALGQFFFLCKWRQGILYKLFIYSLIHSYNVLM